MARTASSVMRVPSWAMAWSSTERPSRTEPSAARAISASAAGSASTSSLAAMSEKCATSVSISTRRRSKRWQRESTVTGSLRTSVVANTNLTWGGGSSSVFNSALKAFFDIMCTSSMM